jgi:hypothetical protein
VEKLAQEVCDLFARKVHSELASSDLLDELDCRSYLRFSHVLLIPPGMRELLPLPRSTAS